jgi:hypothetical protein
MRYSKSRYDYERTNNTCKNSITPYVAINSDTSMSKEVAAAFDALL